MDDDEFKVKCKYCKRLLNARYLQLLRHSLTNTHLCNAAAAVTVSVPMDVDSCIAPDGSVMQSHLSGDGQTVTDVEEGGGRELAGEADDAESVLDDSCMLFVADNATGSFSRHKKVGFF